jgi:hypothetical protein
MQMSVTYVNFTESTESNVMSFNHVYVIYTFFLGVHVECKMA